MTKYVCTVCGYVYDPEAGDPDNGVAPGTKWEDVPEDWVCPLCAVGKDMFEAQQSSIEAKIKIAPDGESGVFVLRKTSFK